MATISTAGVHVRTGLADRYRTVRRFTEQLAEPLSPEDQTVQTMPDVSPTKWHRAHTTWFFETFVLEAHQPGHRPFDPAYRFLFNSYYEAVGPRHARVERGTLTRPGVAEIASYRRAVDDRVQQLLADGGADDPDVSRLVELGLHHEQQHQELLLMDIKHVLAANPLHPAYLPPGPPPAPGVRDDDGDAGSAADQRSDRRWIEHPGGVVPIGHDGDGFAYDNEGPRHEALLTPFAVAAELVTCGDWLDFVADGGYERPDLWMSDGWATVQREGWEAPGYWFRPDDEPDGAWHVQTLYGPRPVDRREPVVHVSWYEADAFARWAGVRLPDEREWETLATAAAEGGDPVAGVGLDGLSLAAGGLHPPAGSVADERWTGAVWQWTASPYAKYPGFQPAAGAVGEYNGKFMVNQQVLRGGACITPAGHTRTTYRNFFYPASRWAFAGLRLADDR
jgi:ergothioneine biosynthesis protein EgtB